MSTDLGLLNDGITWAYSIALVLSAFTSKFGSCALTARLVELIVLDLGLSAGIFTQRVFTMFVLEALILTFVTAPLAILLYPYHVRKKNTDAIIEQSTDESLSEDTNAFHRNVVNRVTIVLDRLEHLPCAMEFATLVSSSMTNQRSRRPFSSSSSLTKALPKSPSHSEQLLVEALRIIELSDRPSVLMKSSMTDALLSTDPLLAAYRMFGHLHALRITSAIAVVVYDDMARSAIEHAQNYVSDIILLPWLPSQCISIADANPISLASESGPERLLSPATAVKAASASFIANSSAISHTRFLQDVFEHAKTNVAVFVAPNDDNAQTIVNRHIFLPYFGGHDDCLALKFVVQCCHNETVTATVLRMIDKDLDPTIGKSSLWGTQETIKTMAWEQYASTVVSSSENIPALTRIEFRDRSTDHPIHASILEAENSRQPGLRLLTVVGRGIENQRHAAELKDLMAEYGCTDTEMKKTIGDVATAFAISRCGEGVIILQAAKSAHCSILGSGQAMET
ncbi:hypothetical protein H0H87_001125 [Tephrocybe sp. NHM501043]|nr:hypothetical protein H0H87_001125 [Tephrocybe sp. NHM501043]